MLTKMAYKARPSKTSSNLIDVDIPPTRADTLHQMDIMEDAVIAYGIHELPRSFPRTTSASAAVCWRIMAESVQSARGYGETG